MNGYTRYSPAPGWTIWRPVSEPDMWCATRDDLPHGSKRYVNARGQLVDIDSSSRHHPSWEAAEEAIALYMLKSGG